MNAEIYYFSGSGNSLAVARDLAAKRMGKLISIPSLMNKDHILPDADVIGIVFPVYYASLGQSGIPLIVGRFIGKLENIGSRYLFAVCTHGGAAGATIENLSRSIHARGGQLAGGFTVKMSNPYSVGEKLRYLFLHKALEANIQADNEKQRELFAHWKKKLELIDSYIEARKTGTFETRSAGGKFILAPFLAMQTAAALSRYRKLSKIPGHSLEDLIPFADRSFRTDERCNGCGICARVCPVHNIELVDTRPVWQQACETCNACFQWCPTQAIHGEIVEFEKRYHHPDVKLSDMLME